MYFNFIPRTLFRFPLHRTYNTSIVDQALIGPAVRNLLLQYGLRPNELLASGPKSNLVKGDVLRVVGEKGLRAVAVGAGAPAVATTAAAAATVGDSRSLSRRFNFTYDDPTGRQAPFIDIELTNMRRTIAKRLFQSKSTIPHAYETIQVNLSPILNFRKDLSRQSSGLLKTSINDFIIKCTANALGKNPGINVVWEGNQIVSKSQIDISIAVATSSGLITPIVTNVGSKSIMQISQNVRELAERARASKLQPAEFMGGTFTISNLGMFGQTISHFSAIINPPQCGILAVGGGIPSHQSTRLNLTLSYDARAISEESVAVFLAQLKHEIETPSLTSIGIYNIESQIDILDYLTEKK